MTRKEKYQKCYFLGLEEYLASATGTETLVVWVRPHAHVALLQGYRY
jgi:hypothetical protein